MKRLSDTNLLDRRRFLLGVAKAATAGAVLGPAVVKAGPPGSKDCGHDKPGDLDTSVRARLVPQDRQSGHDFGAVRADGDLFKDLLLPQLDPYQWPPTDLGDYKIAAPPQVVVPSDGRVYDDARQTFNLRYQRYPAAIFFALNTEQVQAAVRCAVQLNLQVSAAGNRNSFLSMATPDGSIVIDLSHMKSLSLDTDAMIATVGPGVIGPMLNMATLAHGIPGLSAATGVCGFVGIVPWTLGGGLGFQGHRLGLGCDNLVNVEMVLSDGRIVNANEKENSDLFWASQGGGGGTFGIVTSMDVKLHVLPNEGRISAFYLVYTGKEAFVKGFDAFQKWFPTASRLWGIDQPRLAPVLTGTPNPLFSFLCYYFGSSDDAAAELDAAGLLFDVGGSVKFVKMGDFPDHQTWYGLTQSTVWLGGAGIPTTPTAIINGLSNNAFGQPYMVQAMQTESVIKALYGGHDAVNGIPSSPFLGTQVVGGKYYHLNQYVVNRFLDRVPVGTLRAAADFLADLSEASMAGDVVPGLVFAGGHTLGGAYADRAPTDTAFFWRRKLMVLYFSFGIPPGTREILTDEEYALGRALTDKFLEIFCPRHARAQAAYVNYQQECFDDWQSGYFGENYDRLLRIKTKYDPYGRFDKAYTVQARGRSSLR